MNPPQLAFRAQNFNFSKANFETHVGVSLEGPSRSEPINTHFWLTVPAAALIPIFLPPAPSFAAPGVGGTLIRARTLRHHMSQRSQTFRFRPIAPCVACDRYTRLQLSVQSSAPVVASGCTRWGRSGGRAAAAATRCCHGHMLNRPSRRVYIPPSPRGMGNRL